MNEPIPDVPKNFGIKYVAWVLCWFLWSNAISVLSVLGAVFTAITLDPTMVSHDVFHYILLGNFALTAILAQINRKRPSNSDPSPLSKPPESK